MALDTVTPDAAEGFHALFRREFGPVVRTVYLMVGDAETAHDVAQEAFVRLYVHWKRIRNYDRPDAWVRRVAVNLASKTRRRAFLGARAHAKAAKLVTEPAEREPSDPGIRQAVLSLPPKQRAAVVLHYLEDMSVNDVAHILRCKEATARVHLHRARERLRDALGGEHE